MALHEQSIGKTDEWYTPPHVFSAMGVRFDLDVAHPGGDAADWIPAIRVITKGVGGLRVEWSLHSHHCPNPFVWMNPPFGGRNGIAPWLEKFFNHGNGVALVPDRTSAPWWQTYAAKADAILFVSPKLKFIGLDGQPGKSPAQGTALLAAGARGVAALESAERNGLGLLFQRRAAA